VEEQVRYEYAGDDRSEVSYQPAVHGISGIAHPNRPEIQGDGIERGVGWDKRRNARESAKVVSGSSP
jgi:hypothetical protein